MKPKEDGRFSKDLEDIVYVLNNRSTIWTEMKECREAVRKYFKIAFKSLLEEKYIYDWISSHLEWHNPFLEFAFFNLLV